MEVLQDGKEASSSTVTADDNNILITLAVSLDQEMAIRTFFQVNEWPLIEGGTIYKCVARKKLSFGVFLPCPTQTRLPSCRHITARGLMLRT